MYLFPSSCKYSPEAVSLGRVLVLVLEVAHVVDVFHQVIHRLAIIPRGLLFE